MITTEERGTLLAIWEEKLPDVVNWTDSEMSTPKVNLAKNQFKYFHTKKVHRPRNVDRYPGHV